MPKARTAPLLTRRERKGRSRLTSRAIHGGIQANVTSSFASFCTDPQGLAQVQTLSVKIDRRVKAKKAKERDKHLVQMVDP